jgi:hypothetical protein
MMADLSASDPARRAWFESKQAMIRAYDAWICIRCCYFWWPWTDQTSQRGPDCCASLISVLDRLFFAILSPNWWSIGVCNGPNLVPPAKWVAPLGAPPYPNGQALSGRNLVSAARCKRINSDHSGHQNKSARWRCPKIRIIYMVCFYY